MAAFDIYSKMDVGNDAAFLSRVSSVFSKGNASMKDVESRERNVSCFRTPLFGKNIKSDVLPPLEGK